MYHLDYFCAMKVLLVCLGNICRSPMAEGILRDIATRNGLEIYTDSAGTGDWHIGESPDRRAIACLKSKGLNISDLTARQITKSDFTHFDFILTMDDSNYKNVLALNPGSDSSARIKPVLNYHPEYTGQSVPDPYFGGDEGFEHVYNLLDVALKAFVKTEYHENNG